MFDIEYCCQDILPMFQNQAVQSLDGLRFYLETLEAFIDRERTLEIRELERDVEQWSSNQREEFWTRHYPIYWDEIFVSQLRSSLVSTLISLAEWHIGLIADQVREIMSVSDRPDDLRGGLLKQHHKYLQAVAGFTRPSDASWSCVYEIRDVRNCIVHANGSIFKSRNPSNLRSLVRKLPGLSATHEVLDLSPEFLIYSLNTVQEFTNELYEEASALCHRVSNQRSN